MKKIPEGIREVIPAGTPARIPESILSGFSKAKIPRVIPKAITLRKPDRPLRRIKAVIAAERIIEEIPEGILQ